jgi:hypothetical protein
MGTMAGKAAEAALPADGEAATKTRYQHGHSPKHHGDDPNQQFADRGGLSGPRFANDTLLPLPPLGR